MSSGSNGLNSIWGGTTSMFEPAEQLAGDFVTWIDENQDDLCLMVTGIALTFIAAALISWLFDRCFRRVTSRIDSTGGDFADGARRLIVDLVLLSGIYGSISILSEEGWPAMMINKAYSLLAVLIIVRGAHRMINAISRFLKKTADRTGTSFDNLMVDLLRRVAKAVLWTIAIFFVAQNIFDLNISAMLAGAGVVGLAVAFAAQNTIANIFGAVTLILDKPFKVGDRIIVSGKDGIVESVGLRSTRIRGLDGTLWVVPNKEMTDSSIQNFSLRPNFKQVFEIGLVYGTPADRMKRAVELLHEILDGDPLFDMEKLPPRIYFSEFKDWSLNITVIVWFQTIDYFEMLAAREALNLEILKRFNAEGLEFAFPTHTAYLAADASHPLHIAGGDGRDK